MIIRKIVLLTVILAPATSFADRYITNFETAGGGVASGVWRNETTSTDTAIPVSLTQTNAIFDEETVLDDTAPWADVGGNNLFDPNYTGDFVSLEVAGGATASVTIAFNAQITDPTINFSDVDVQTTMVFMGATPVQVAGLPNMLISGNTVTTDGFPSNPFDPTDQETLGSIKFTGVFTELVFDIVNTGSDPSAHIDRTGFSVSTEQAPVAVSMGPPPQLTIFSMGDNLHLSWPDMTSFSQIEYTMNPGTGPWMLLPGSDPTTSTTWSAPFSNFAGDIYIRAVYTP